MKKRITNLLLAVALTAIPLLASAQSGNGLPAGIVWYGVLQDGLEQARKTERPILLLSAAPQCAGVPGMW